MYIADSVMCAENILIVDDVKANLVVLTAIIKKAGFNPRPVSSVKHALEEIDNYMPNLILIDIWLPEIDGFEFCTMLKQNSTTKEIPIILISGINSIQDKNRGYKLGAVDFIIKPFEQEEITCKLKTHLQLYNLKFEMDFYHNKFHNIIYRQIIKITENRKKLIYALAKLIEHNDDHKRKHMEDNAANCKVLSMGLQLSPKFTIEITDSFIDTIHLAALLYDIGELAINPTILYKPDKLSNDEIEILKSHTEIGAKMISEIYEFYDQNEYLKMAIDIAYYHHEKWNGKGYPRGLSGKDIPLAARIMSVIDTYDNLTSESVYKLAYSREESLNIINEESGVSFDPDIIEIFNKIEKSIKISDV